LSEVQYFARSRGRAEGNERGVWRIINTTGEEREGRWRILFIGYKERGDFLVTGYGKSGSERMDEGGGATTQSNLWNPGRELCI
jgi:hypothetical protein